MKIFDAYNVFTTLILFLALQPRLLIKAQSIHNHHTRKSNWNAVNAGLIVMVSAVLLVILYYMLILHCIRSHQRWSAQEAGQTAHQAKGGLASSILETFPVFNYSETSGSGLDKGPLECSVCLGQFEKDEKLRMLPKCKHVFHLDCVNRWLAGHSTCPFCRDELAPLPGEPTLRRSGCVNGSGAEFNGSGNDDIV